MTTVQDHAIDADRRNGSVAPAARLVGVGVRDREHDSAALRSALRLDWIERQARVMSHNQKVSP
jgi:hypothetical protein